MASRGKGARDRGLNWERAIVNASTGFPLQRIRLGFHDDVGDLSGLPCFMVEAKAASIPKIPMGVDKAKVSWTNSGQPWFVMLQKRPNASLKSGWAIMEIDQFFEMMRYLDEVGALSPTAVESWRRRTMDFARESEVQMED